MGVITFNVLTPLILYLRSEIIREYCWNQMIPNTFRNAPLEFEFIFGCLIRKSDSFWCLGSACLSNRQGSARISTVTEMFCKENLMKNKLIIGRVLMFIWYYLQNRKSDFAGIGGVH